MSESWTVLKILQWTTGYFERAGVPAPRVDAEVLLAHVLSLERILLYAQYDRPLTDEERDGFRALVTRRAKAGVPVQYLIGSQEFWSLPFVVEPGVLVPRSDTEVLVEEAVVEAKRLAAERSDAAGEGALRVADVGTGSGCIAVALAHELKEATVWAGDVAEVPLRLAAHNAQHNGVGDRVHVMEADGLLPLAQAAGRAFDLVVSNPPYLRDDEHASLMREVRDHEPKLALTSGATGLDMLERLAEEAASDDVLVPGGALLLEVSQREQAEAVVERLEALGYVDTRIREDYGGIARVVVARRRSR